VHERGVEVRDDPAAAGIDTDQDATGRYQSGRGPAVGQACATWAGWRSGAQPAGERRGAGFRDPAGPGGRFPASSGSESARVEGDSTPPPPSPYFSPYRALYCSPPTSLATVLPTVPSTVAPPPPRARADCAANSHRGIKGRESESTVGKRVGATLGQGGGGG
jgi:hypothetical protein